MKGIYDKWNSDKSAFFPRHDVKSDYWFGMTCLRSTVQEYAPLNKQLSGEIDIIWSLNAKNKEQTLWMKMFKIETAVVIDFFYLNGQH